MTILFLCREEHDWTMILAYAHAFRRRGDSRGITSFAFLDQVLHAISFCAARCFSPSLPHDAAGLTLTAEDSVFVAKR
jgi:hypothetical protein